MRVSHDPFIIHTFIETRGTESYRVFHPIGTDDTRIPKSRLYGDYLRRMKHSPTNPGAYDKNACLRHAILQAECWPDLFLIFADPDALERHDQVIANTVRWSCPSAEAAFWIRMHPNDISIISFPQIPDDHRKTYPHTVRGVINQRPLRQILAELQYEYGLPDFLTSIEDDMLQYEATVHLPKADTVDYNRMREELHPV